jgi:hypothetical protein
MSWDVRQTERENIKDRVIITNACSYQHLSVPSCLFGSSLTSCEAIILRVELQQVTNETGLCPLEILFDLEEVGDGEREVNGALLDKDGLCELEREVDPPGDRWDCLSAERKIGTDRDRHKERTERRSMRYKQREVMNLWGWLHEVLVVDQQVWEVELNSSLEDTVKEETERMREESEWVSVCV